MIYKRGQVWWYKFRINGQVIRESSKSNSKSLARDAERVRRRQLEEATNGLATRKRPALFSVAVDGWLKSLSGSLKPHTIENYVVYARRLKEWFPNRLVVDFDKETITQLQRELKSQGFAGRTVNLWVAVLRMVLRDAGVWGSISCVRMLHESHDVGKAITHEDEARLLEAITQSRSPALLSLFVLSVDSGLRASEIRALKHQDLKLQWHDGVIASGELRVSKSKTSEGEGRTVPLSRRSCAVLSLWLSRFPDADRGSYVYPAHKIGFTGNDRHSDLYGIDLEKPMGSWKKAWRQVLKTAGVSYRWHDCRHTFVSRLLENPLISEQTVKALSGHMSRRMLEHYSHIRTSAKQAAIATLDAVTADFGNAGAQKWAQSPTQPTPASILDSKKSLN